MPNKGKIRTLGCLLYPGFELLDVFGPLEMFGNIGDELKMVMVAERPNSVASAQGPSVMVNYAFEHCPHLDLLLVPGGIGTREEVTNEVLLDWLREFGNKAELVMSVCSGSAILAKAGLLDGHKATSNKMSFKWITEQGPEVNWIKEARWVTDGNRVTSSGVTAGMDMALAVIEQLYGRERADKLAKYTEYTRERDPSNDPFAKLWD